MKFRYTFLLICLTIPAALLAASEVDRAPVRTNKDLPPRQRVREAKSYYCYYGSGRVAELSHYDLVILHTPATTADDVRQLKAAGVVTVGYISVGADETIRIANGKGPGGKASWYFDKDHDGKPDCDSTWKSPWANCGDPEWRKDRIEEARRLINQVGFDGLFLDTTDNVSIFPEMFDGMVELISDLRGALPDAPIIMNQSWDLLRKVAPEIDGLMLEGFSTSYNFETKSYRRNPPAWDDNGLFSVNKYVVPLRKQYPFQVVVLDYAEPTQTAWIQEARDRAATMGFLHAVAPVGLDEIYHVNGIGHANEKWLQRQATPESLSVKLDQERNGFAAGTEVLPSGCFAGYTVAPVVDGLTERAGLDWSKVAWASAEDDEPAFLEFRLPESRSGGVLSIEFQGGAASRNFLVQTKAAADVDWADLASVKNNQEQSCSIPLPTEPYRWIRIFQNAGGGSSDRPNLLWISRVKLISR